METLETLERLRSGVMTRYLGAFANKVDPKGRLSIPADFRNAIATEAEDGSMLCFPAFKGQVLDCGGSSLISILVDMVANLDHFDEDREVLEYTIMSGIHRLSFDETGRIVLPKSLREQVNITGRAVVIGMGDRFQICSADYHENMKSKAAQIASSNRDVFRARSLPSVTGRKERG